MKTSILFRKCVLCSLILLALMMIFFAGGESDEPLILTRLCFFAVAAGAYQAAKWLARFWLLAD